MSKPSYRENQVIAGGVPEGFDASVLARAVDREPVVHIARDDTRLASMQVALRFFAPDIPVFTFPAWDCLPYDRVSPNAEISSARMALFMNIFQTAMFDVGVDVCGRNAGMPQKLL